MRSWPIALLASAGCFRPTPPAGAPCAPEGAGPRCPAGQVCTLTGGTEVCLDGSAIGSDGGPDVDACTNCPDADGDGDGVVDADDNCPTTPNADQDDEDSDAVGDACDPCPPVANATADADGDGVADACDPRPNTPGDQIRFFVGFRSGLPAGWTAVNFAADGDGNAIGTAPGGGGATLTIAKPSGNVTVWADATLQSIAGGGLTLGAIGVMTLSERGVDDNVVCQVVGQPNGNQQFLRLFDNATGLGLIDEDPHTFDPGDRFELRVDQVGNALSCAATNPNALAIGSSSYAPSQPEIGLRVRSATATYHWMMVISSP